MTRLSSSALLVALYTLLFFFALLYLLRSFVSPLVPDPYMDEVFHVPQASRFAQGRWGEWDPKITTFPGLYLTAVAYVRAIAAALRTGAACGVVDPRAAASSAAEEQLGESVQLFRSLNVLYGSLCVPLFALLLRTLHGSALSPRSLVLATVQLSLFPLLFFFHLLFYSDSGSVFWTLLAYLAHLHRLRTPAAVAAAVAVLMRQTNVVWVGFMLLTSIVREWERGDSVLFHETRPHELRAAGDSSTASAPAEGEKESKLAAAAVELYAPTRWSSVPRSCAHMAFSCLRNLPALVAEHWGLLSLCVAFVIFVVFVNGGSIVVGDKSNHAFSMHLAQVGYFVAFLAGLSAPNWLSCSMLRSLVSTLRRSPLTSAGTLIFFAACVHYGTVAHPFLLADNRHYTFYLWSRLLSRPALRLAAAPAYVCAGAVVQSCWSGEARRSLLFQAAFWLCSFLCLVPTPLLELRYFTTPALIWMLHSAPTLCASTSRTMASIALYAAINAATLWMFLYRPFEWADGSVARFMW